MSEQKSDMIEAVSLQYLAEVLQGAGYRTNESEQNGGKQLLSASQGIGFAVRPGNPVGQGPEMLKSSLLGLILATSRAKPRKRSN